MIIDNEPCSPDELESLYDYLMGTPVAKSVRDMFNAGKMVAYHAQITRLEELGEHYLIWSNLGGFIQRPKYKVKEAYDVLRNAKDYDIRSNCNWITVNDYIDLLAQNALQLKITVAGTIVDSTPIDIIIDGCKRTTAFHEYKRRLGVEDVDFNLMILRHIP